MSEFNRIKDEEPQLMAFLKSQKLMTDNLEAYLEDERQYLEHTQREWDDDITTISAQYVQLLDKFALAKGLHSQGDAIGTALDAYAKAAAVMTLP
jgi:hypothetical protein